MLSDCWHGFCSRVRQHCTAAAHLQTITQEERACKYVRSCRPDIEVVDRNDNLRTVEERMATKQLRHLPVLEQGEVVGMVTQRDLFKAAMSSTMGYGEKAQQAYLQSVRVKEIMVYPVVTVAPDTSVAAAADMMMNKGIGCLPVVEGQQLIGIVTKTDLLRCLRALDAA